MINRLALNGGTAVRSAPWPLWPQPAAGANERLKAVLSSARWAITGQYRGVSAFNTQFSEQFSAYLGLHHCVPVVNGSASLVCALEACDVGAGDEVIVPGLTWLASASAALRVNAVPVLADIDPLTLCIDANQIQSLITPRTRAIQVVHLYSAMADLDAILDVAKQHQLPVIEDCAQSHGATYRNRKSGSFGAVGAFSFQNGKVLTCGEGGAVVTDNSAIYRRLEQLRCDGRLPLGTTPPLHGYEFTAVGELMGGNYCLSEFQAAVLVSQLEELDAQNERRRVNASHLNDRLQQIGPYQPQRTSSQTTYRTYYHYALSVDTEAFGLSIDAISAAISAELGLRVARIYPPMNDWALYAPAQRRRFHISDEFLARVNPRRYDLPHSHRAYETHLSFHHSALLGSESDMDQIVEAFAKVYEMRKEIKEGI